MRQRGSALITALFIMTLVSIAATAISLRLQSDIERTRLTLASDKLYLASQLVSFWAMDTLRTHTKPWVTKDADGQLIELPKNLQTIYPDVSVNGALFDLQAKFNLNNLQDKSYKPYFYRLLQAILDKPNQVNAGSLVENTFFWVNIYQQPKGPDALLAPYLKLKPAYYPSFQAMTNVSEFRLVTGVSSSIYTTMFSYVSALPEVLPINIMTASKPILMALGNGLKESQANKLFQLREEDQASNPIVLNNLLQTMDVPQSQITLESSYFLSVATVTSHDLTLVVYTTIKRVKDKQGNVSIGVVSERWNTD